MNVRAVQPEHVITVDGRFDDWAEIEGAELAGTHAQQFSKIALEPRAGTQAIVRGLISCRGRGVAPVRMHLCMHAWLER